MTDAPFVTVIVPAYNAAHTLPDCLRALAAQSYPRERFEIIVVDDGSSDATTRVARVHGARVLQRPHSSPAAARNAGVAMTHGDLLLFTDADCEPDTHWIAAFVAALEPGVAGGKGVYRTRQRGLLPRFIQAEFTEKYARLAEHEWIDFVDTSSAAYRRADFEAEGGFDPLFPTASAEDVELSFRMAAHGRRLRFVPEAVVYHLHPTALWDYLWRKVVYGFWRGYIYRRRPGKALRDTYTPRLVRLQIGVAGLIVVGAVGLPLLGGWPLLALAVLFAAMTVPFTWRARAAGSDVALCSPALIFLRALAQAAGLGAGLALAGPARWLPGVRRGVASVDLTWITSQLAIGSAMAARSPAALVALGVTGVLDLRAEASDDAELLAEHGLRFLHLPVPDRAAIPDRLLAEGLAWLREELDRGGRVLVHCHAGSGRSATIVTALLVHMGEPLGSAYEAVRRKRRHVALSSQQLEMLRAFERRARAGA